jgi:aminoglycoside phosphotransferase (APT) family kinase protein
MARRAIEVGALAAMEVIRRPRPSSADDVPGSAKEFTPEWLSAILCHDVPGARVESFTTPSGSVGTSTRVALRVVYNETGRRAGLPTDLFVKLAATYRQRVLLGAVDVLRGETAFFTKLRPMIDMETPLGYGGAVDERAWKSFVVIEDVAATKGAEFIPPIHPLTRPQVEDLLENLARMHGAMWEHPALDVLHKTPRRHFALVSQFFEKGERYRVGLERAQSVVHPALHGQAHRVWEGAHRSLALTDSLPRTLLHGDAHVGQTYITRDGRMGWVDWQVAMQGSWSFDFGYFVSSACDPADRRVWERELLELYLERLTEHGGQPPAFDEAYRSYCQQLFYPCAAWACTIGRAAYQQEMQPKEYSLVLLKRMSAAIADNDAFKTIGM